MKRCVIFAAMPVSESLQAWWKNADYVIAADAGYKTAQRLGVQPDLLLGDYDSAPVPKTSVETVHLPIEKDDTDTYYAARRALKTGCDEVVILGGTGGRLDHTMANLQTLVFLARHHVRALLVDESTQVTVLLPGTHEVPAQSDVYCSVFPIGARAGGVTLEGLQYPLQNAMLTNAYPVGVSNAFTAPCARICVKTGGLYLMLCRKE